MNRYYWFLVLFAMNVLNMTAFAGDFDIVSRHQARAYILLAENVDNIEKEAAKDLQWAVQKTTGVTLEIVETPINDTKLIPIRIGSISDHDDWLQLSYDGGIIRVTPNGINITGKTPAGTSNAVATILMKDIGIRTYYPHPLFTITPKTETITIRSRTANPSFYYRIWSGLTKKILPPIGDAIV